MQILMDCEGVDAVDQVGHYTITAAGLSSKSCSQL